MCKLMDEKGDGNDQIDWPEFRKMMQNEAFVTYMASVGLEVHNPTRFYLAIAKTLDGKLTIDEFVQGCMHMRGGSSAIDMRKLLVDIQHMHAIQNQQLRS